MQIDRGAACGLLTEAKPDLSQRNRLLEGRLGEMPSSEGTHCGLRKGALALFLAVRFTGARKGRHSTAGHVPLELAEWMGRMRLFYRERSPSVRPAKASFRKTAKSGRRTSTLRLPNRVLKLFKVS